MKTTLTKLLAAIFVSLALIVSARAIDITFYSAQNSGGGYTYQYQNGYVQDDNPGCYPYATAYSPATDLWMPYYNPNSGFCAFEAQYYTNGAKGTYYIGTFMGATTDFYVQIY